MKIQTLISMAMAAVMMAACSYEDELSAPLQKGVLTASVEGSRSTTRAGFDAGGKFYWSAIDYLGVTTSGNTASFTKLEMKTGGGTASATFEGTVSGTIEGYAVYPYNDDHSMNGTELTYNFPSSYTYNKVDTDFFTTPQGEGNSFNPAMWGSIVNGSVQLKHLGGVFCIKIEKMPVTAGKLTLTTDKKIAGSYTVDLNTDKPALIATASSDTYNTVTIKFSEATQNSPGVFYVPVPTGTYNNVRIKVMGNDDSEKVNVSAGTYIITRQYLKKIELSNGSIDATVPTTSANLSDAQNNLASSDAVSVTGEISSTGNEITIPSVSSTGVSKSLSLEQVASGASLAVKDGSGASSVKNFTLSIPNNETADFEPLDVTITMPNTTVTLAGNGGVTTYGTVTACTVENTLVLSSGVKVENVIVQKGNVRVNNGSTLVAIENQSGTTVTIYKEEGATLPTSIPEGFEVVDAAVSDMETVGANGGSYVLQSDIVLNRPLVISKDVTIDLNGHALIANEAGLTKVLNTSDAVVLVRRGAQLTINDRSNDGEGCIDANGVETVYCAVKLTDKDDGTEGEPAKLIVNRGRLIGYYYGISGNGMRHNTEITINGGTVQAYYLLSDGVGIYHPQEGKLTVNGGAIAGNGAGIELRSGTLKITDGIVHCTGSESASGPNGNGTTITGAALAVSQHTTNKDILVSITGGLLEGPYALYEEDLQDGIVDNIKIAGVSGETFNGKVYSENCSQFISGGTFSDPSALAYLAENANVKIALQGDYEGPGFGLFKGGNGDSATVEIDLQNNTWTLTDEPLFGSPGTKSQYFHLEKDATVKFKEGKLVPKDNASGKMLIQNYCNLNLENVSVKCGSNCQYILSNNNGSCTITNSKIIADKNQCAFDVYYWPDGGYPDGVTVTLIDSYIEGKVEFGGDSTGKQEKKGKLIVKGESEMNGNLEVTEGFYNEDESNIIIESSVVIANGVTGWDAYRSSASN